MNRLETTLAEFDRINREDPNTVKIDGQTVGKEWLYGQRMSERLLNFCPKASELLQLAARAQHIQRWLRPRSDYPEGRTGYHQWRTDLNKFHAEIAAGVMQKNGYSDPECERVSDLLQKKNLKRDTEAQCLEDVICLVFIEHYLIDFVKKYSDPQTFNYSEDKLINIVQKTWRKMSPAGRQAALKLPLARDLSTLISKALNDKDATKS